MDPVKSSRPYISLKYSAFRYLTYRQRSVHEMEEYLKKKCEKKNYSPELIPVLIDELMELKYLDEAEFARWFISYGTRGKKKGMGLLKRELKMKGVDDVTIETVTSFDESAESERAYTVLLPKWRTYQKLEKQKRTARAYGFLARKGYSGGVIQQVLKRLEEEQMESLGDE